MFQKIMLEIIYQNQNVRNEDDLPKFFHHNTVFWIVYSDCTGLK